jgi:hypothetical protein
MSAQQQITKLRGLLERIKKNAGRPRVSAPITTAGPAFTASSGGSDVDDLLAASPAPSPLPVEVDVTLESVPPDADAAAIPLVSMSSGGAAPPVEDTLGMEGEVSEVRVTTGMREPATEVTVAAIAAEAEPLGAEELSEDDLVEVTDMTSVPPPVATDVDIDFDDEDEQPPASSQRSKVASSMDEALAAAAAQLEAEREVPIKTPPPESGPQEAPMPAGLAAPAAPDVDALLGQELDIPTRAQDAGPTTEQLGQTIDLEEARGPALELAEPKSESAPRSKPIEELEVALPGPAAGGGYHEQLQPPPEAQQELEAHRRRLEDDVPPPAALVSAGPEVVARPTPDGSPETFSSVRESFQPSSFLELLDASLGLNGE